MRKGNVLFSAVHFLVTAAIFCFGIFFISLRYFPGVRSAAVEFFATPHAPFGFIGFFLLGLSLLLLIGLYVMNRAQYIQLEMNVRDVFVEEAIVKEGIERFWKEHFAPSVESLDVTISGGKIAIIAPMPDGEQSEQTLEAIEQKLGQFLSKRFGYRHPFSLSLTLR